MTNTKAKPQPAPIHTSLSPTPATSSSPPSPPHPTSGTEGPPDPHTPGSLQVPKTYHLPNVHSPIKPNVIISDDGDGNGYLDEDGTERQPLLPAGRQALRRRVAYPILLILFMLLFAGVFVGVGGWRLGRGQGRKRWPGGPH